MRIYLRILVGVGALLIRVETVQAQLDNSAFTSPEPGRKQFERDTQNDPIDSLEIRVPQVAADKSFFRSVLFAHNPGDIRFSLNSFTFFKDNEYFNKIVDGYTLFGAQLNPQLAYYPAQNLRVEGGVFLWKDFGNPQLKQVRPTFRATWTVGKEEAYHQFILGNIKAQLNHDYIEPMFNFERVMLNPLEEGLQYRYITDKLTLEVWVDWQRQQYRYSNYQEEIAGGLINRYTLSDKTSPWQVSVPFQFTATHYGGQIDTLSKPLQTLFNEAIGIEARRTFTGVKVQAFRFNGYVLGFQDNSPTQGQNPFKYGRGLYLNTTLETRYADVMLSYWQGARFLAPLGGDLFQSASRTVSNPDYLDRQRRILLVRLLRDFRISDAAALTVRVEPLYDFNAKLLDFSFGVYLNFRQEWLLGNVGRRVRVGQ